MLFGRLAAAGLLIIVPSVADAQQWGGFGGDPQHTGLSAVAAQPLNRVHWQTPVDLAPEIANGDILIHYGSPLVTTDNSVVVPVKTGPLGGFRLDIRNGADGSLKYTLATDYILPPHNWTPSFGPVLTPGGRLYWAGAGGTVFFRDQPDLAGGATGRIAFFGDHNYAVSPEAYNETLMVSTPLVADRAGEIFFGFTVTGGNPPNLSGGIAKIDSNGVGSFITAASLVAGNPEIAGGDPNFARIPLNSTPSVSNDQRNLYFAVARGENQGTGFLAEVNSASLARVAMAPLLDPKTGQPAFLGDDGTASPVIGPDGDVYMGVLENPEAANHGRGWLLHFNATLNQIRITGAFGWDDTPSVVPSRLVPSYHGASAYLLLTKYNNYADAGGDGVSRLALLDPRSASYEPISGGLMMTEVLTVAGVTPDPIFRSAFPSAVREWCINSAAIDAIHGAALVNSEDGTLYLWDFASNALKQRIPLTGGTGEAYTPTLIGADGTVYAINHAILFASGR